MPRSCTACQHPDRAALEAALVAVQPVRQVASVFTVSPSAVARHAANHLPETLARAAQAVAAVQVEQTADALDVMAELRRTFERLNLLFDACDRWLRDVDDPSRYDIGPRAEDVLVTYLEAGPDGELARRKAPISRLLARLQERGVQVDGWETKHADPRELVLKTAAQLRPSIELLAKLVGELD